MRVRHVVIEKARTAEDNHLSQRRFYRAVEGMPVFYW
jgi:hypothetical protein